MSFDGSEETADEALLARFAAGDQTAALLLTRRLTPRVLALATRMLRDPAEAEDVAQEAMLRLWRAAPEWRAGEAKPSTWLHRVTTNLCIDRLRKSRRSGPPLDEVAEPPTREPSVEARLAAGDRAALVKAALARLPDRQRRAVVLRHFEGLGNPAIAEALGVTVEAVESLLTRGRRALAADVAAAEVEEDAARGGREDGGQAAARGATAAGRGARGRPAPNG
ncbi:MAG: RNA polymerase sigma factor [Pseudomonadota bacterium]